MRWSGFRRRAPASTRERGRRRLHRVDPLVQNRMNLRRSQRMTQWRETTAHNASSDTRDRRRRLAFPAEIANSGAVKIMFLRLQCVEPPEHLLGGLWCLLNAVACQRHRRRCHRAGAVQEHVQRAKQGGVLTRRSVRNADQLENMRVVVPRVHDKARQRVGVQRRRKLGDHPTARTVPLQCVGAFLWTHPTLFVGRMDARRRFQQQRLGDR